MLPFMKRSFVTVVVTVLGCAGFFTLKAGLYPTNLISFKPFNGIAYSPFRGSENPYYSSYPTVAEITQDITNSLIYLASEVATYGMAGGQSNIAAVCYNYNLPCYPCAFLSPTDIVDNSNEIAALVAVGNQHFPTTRGLLVGSEPVFDNYNPDALINDINHVRAATGNIIPVGTRDIFYTFTNFPAIAAACDFIQVDIHPYWAELPESEGAAFVIDEWRQLTNEFPGVKVIIGETGWPTGGSNPYWSSPYVVTSVATQGQYLKDFVSAAKSNNIEYFVFSFRDEAWKSQEGWGDVECHWGLYDTNGVKKQSLVDYLANGFSIRMSKASSTNAHIIVPTFEGNPYSIVATPDIRVGPWTPYPFTGAAGTNQTVITVPIFTNAPLSWFYFGWQNF